AIPGPRIDLTRELASWFDRWLRDGSHDPHEDRVEVFVRSSTRPEVDLEVHHGSWVTDVWPSPSTSWEPLELVGAHSLEVLPDTGTAAWIDCAGHLPRGLPADQRGA